MLFHNLSTIHILGPYATQTLGDMGAEVIKVEPPEGDSMRPTLEDGDTVLVDMNQKSPMPPGIFVLHDGMGLVAKRLEHVPNSTPPAVRVISDNGLYSPYERTSDEINIVGRIRWFGREM